MSKRSKRNNRKRREKIMAKRQKRWVMENVYRNVVEKNMNYIVEGVKDISFSNISNTELYKNIEIINNDVGNMNISK